ncbi:unnamed protein product [Prunus armeniaca]|uniref:Uncharacterized protein n=1 Tax=Prunus armeniaca TaxID=36596 RepID=A0A6J5TZU5_PRUAR|nr:unnamed protein product [Prunus armeniaca]
MRERQRLQIAVAAVEDDDVGMEKKNERKRLVRGRDWSREDDPFRALSLSSSSLKTQGFGWLNVGFGLWIKPNEVLIILAWF